MITDDDIQKAVPLANPSPVRENLTLSSSSQTLGLTEAQHNLAIRLIRRHGKIRAAVERSGLHFYMPSPICLIKDGAVELNKMHLAINISKFEKGKGNLGKCMKYDVVYSMQDLLAYPTLEARGFKLKDAGITGNAAVLDSGPPPMPGTLQSILELHANDPDHPCLLYLRSRGFTNYKALYQHMRFSYCSEPNPIFGPVKLPLSSTPAGRVIFFIEEFNTIVGWQGRLLELTQDGVTYFWNYRLQEWVAGYTTLKDGTKEYVAPLDRFQPVRYYLPKNSAPSAHLLGYDAARKFNDGKAKKWIGLAEGPFDIARVGPPFCATMSKYCNDARANLISRIGVDKVFVVCDNDIGKRNKDAGEVLWETTNIHFVQKYNIPAVRIPLPGNYKDMGEAPADLMKEHINQHLRKHGFEESSHLI